MAQITIQIILICVFIASINGLWTKKKNWPVKAVGKVTCGGKPMPNVYIKLMDKDVLFHDTMGTTRANSNGQFSVSGSGRDGLHSKPEPFIRVYYNYAGTYGRMKVVKVFKITRKGNTRARSYSSYLNFGTINFSSRHCRAYLQFYKALKDYSIRSGHSLPYSTLYVQTDALIHGGTPYATTSTIRIPKKYSSVSLPTAKHELAHTIRHSFDGSLGHFLIDVIRFKYAQHHSCSKKTNYGFAFNEGWAQFWAGSCKGVYGGNPKDYRYEGNVAEALRKLKEKCKSSWWRMVNVLRKNRGRIHRFWSYNSRHYSLYKCKL